MEADVLNALKAKAAYFTGGKDRRERWLICVPVPAELHPWTKRSMELALTYLLTSIQSPNNASIVTDNSNSSSSPFTQFTLLVDTQKCSHRLTRWTLRHIQQIVAQVCQRDELRTSKPTLDVAIVLIRSDAFWDKQLVENCTKTSTNSGTSCNNSNGGGGGGQPNEVGSIYDGSESAHLRY